MKHKNVPVRNRSITVTMLVLACVISLLAAGFDPAASASAMSGDVSKQSSAIYGPPTPRGAWLNHIIFSAQGDPAAAVAQLQAGTIDLYANAISDPALFATVEADPKLAYIQSFGNFTDLTFNPAVFTDTTKLNPFNDPKIREAMNYLVDRGYIMNTIYGGLAQPKFMPLNAFSADTTRYASAISTLETQYAYNLTTAATIINTEMMALGATMGGDGKWQYNSSPVTLIFIIRLEDKRHEMGDYVADQLESVGFTVDRQYKFRSEASPIWTPNSPSDGLWNLYTGGWINTAISRDDGTSFGFFYTPLSTYIPLSQAYTPSAEFLEIATKLWNYNFTSMSERDALFTQGLTLSMQDSVRIWLVDQQSFTPRRANMEVTPDLAGGVAGSSLWPYTIRWKNQVGGNVRIAQPGIMMDPWNPVAGSNWLYDQMPIRATGDFGTLLDPNTGLARAQRVESAVVTVKTGLPVSKTLNWVTLNTADEITVPANAWVDWNATTQRFITAGEKYPGGLTANTKVVVRYPRNLFTAVKWHDGSPLSMGDFLMNMILTFDRAKPASAIYDDTYVPVHEAFLSHFKGVRILSTNPLVIETYDDLFQLDAENIATGWTWFPSYSYGEGSWDMIALGVLAETNHELAFSVDKATTLGVDWMDYTRGPSLAILNKYLTQAKTANYIPYAPTMGAYVTAAEARTRWNNYAAWYRARGHFWLGTGPFYLDKVLPARGLLTLTRYPSYPDLASRWVRYK
jgi:peptide/nickel transport system substrate-binding protein